MNLYYDMKGKPIEIEKWAALFEGQDRIVEKSSMWFGQLQISTVWLGLDHSFGEEKKPLIFETMAFWRGNGDVDVARYATRKEAVAGHNKMVLKLRNPITLWRLLRQRRERKHWTQTWRLYAWYLFLIGINVPFLFSPGNNGITCTTIGFIAGIMVATYASRRFKL